MGKKIRFPLKLSEGAEVRTLEKLREHFDLQAVLEYYKNGKLLTWLEDRYLEGEAEAVQALDEASPDFQRQLCEVFQVEYTGGDVDLEAIERRQERLKRLRSITDEAEYIQNIDRVAFDQEELADLLDEGEERIYLCGEHFTVPASRKGIAYVGVNNPAVHISGKVPEDAAELGIEFVGCACDDQAQNIFVSGTIIIGNRQADKQQRSILPGKLMQYVQSYEMKKFLATDHYYLYCCEIDNDLRWFRYEISTGQETELPSEIANGFTKKVKPEKTQMFVSDHIEELFTVSGDQIGYCPYAGCLCSVDLNTLTAQDYQGFFLYGHQYAFSEKYFAVRLRDLRNPTNIIEVYRNQKILSRIHKLSISKSGEFILDGNVISNTKFQSILNRGIGGEQDALSGIKIFGSTLCFTLSEKTNYKSWVACLDLYDGKCSLFALNTTRTPTLIAKSGQIIYTVSTDPEAQSSGGFTPYVVSTVNLSDGTVKQILHYSSRNSDDYLHKNSQYAIFVDRKKDSDYHIYAIEFDTQRVKLLPYIIEGNGIDAIRKNRTLLVGTTFYCFRYRSYSRDTEIGITCKFDLTENSPQPIELDS